MEKKVVSIRELKYERAYKEFYSDIRNKAFSRNVFFKCDVVNKPTFKIS